MENDFELAIIFKKFIDDDGMVGYYPVEVVEGFYDETLQCFFDRDKSCYKHMIYNPMNYCFLDRISYSELKKSYPHSTYKTIKEKYLSRVKKSEYLYLRDDQVSIGVPVILYGKMTDEKPKLLLDKDVLTCYYDHYNDFFNKLLESKDNIDEVYFKIINSETMGEVKEETLEEEKVIKDSKFDVKKLYDEISKTVIDQDEPIMKILNAIRKQYNNFSKKQSRNILINGGTGVGKTEIFRILSKLIDIPCVMTSATQYSATGYVGGNVESMLESLLKKANGDLEKAQRGILIIDEVDKLSETNKERSQVNQKDVQEALLKILEDGVLPIDYNGQKVNFDTSNLLVVAMGSWSRVEVVEENKRIGFGAEISKTKKTYKDITREDMVKNGLVADFVGRFKIIVQMNDLTVDSFLKILKSKTGVLSQNIKYFNDEEDVKLVVDESAYDAIAKKAASSMFGARDLDSIVEEALSSASFEIASNPGLYDKLIIDENTINDNKKYTLVKKDLHK